MRSPSPTNSTKITNFGPPTQPRSFQEPLYTSLMLNLRLIWLSVTDFPCRIGACRRAREESRLYIEEEEQLGRCDTPEAKASAEPKFEIYLTGAVRRKCIESPDVSYVGLWDCSNAICQWDFNFILVMNSFQFLWSKIQVKLCKNFQFFLCYLISQCFGHSFRATRLEIIWRGEPTELYSRSIEVLLQAEA